MYFRLLIPLDWCKIMRITCNQLILALGLACVSYAHSGHSQQILDLKVTASFQQTPLKEVLVKLESQTNVKFVYSRNLVDTEQRINMSFKKANLGEVLDRLLSPSGIVYHVVSNRVVLSKRAVQMSSQVLPGYYPSDPAFFEETLPTSIFVEQIIKGRVVDEKGEGLPGVSIIVKGTQLGTVTNETGQYSIRIPDQNAILTFSFVGYLSQEVVVGNRTEINLEMVPEISSLQEVVVVGYGTVKKSDLTGSVASVKPEDLERIPVTNVNQALQGRAAGVQIRQTQQQPGGGLSVRIRGISSIQGNTQPLYVIDGIIGGDINTLNPQDIESLEILKDASATAIFGANGANGVILITTKRGSADKNVINFNSYLGMQYVHRRLDLLNAEEYIRIDRERRDLFGQEQVFSPTNIPHNTDWQDEIFQTAPMQNYNLSASGGTQKIRYFASANYIRQEGVVIDTDYSRFNLRLNLDAQINNRLKVGTRIGLSRDNRGRMSGEGELNRESPTILATFMQPVLSPYDAEGMLYPELEYVTVPPAVSRIQNPIHYSKYLIDRDKATAITGTVFSEINLMEGLKFKPSFNFTLNNGKSTYYKPSIIFTNSLGYRNEARVSTSDGYRWNSDMVLSYEKSFSKDHNFEILGGFIVNKLYRESLGSAVRDFALDVFDYHNLSAGSNILDISTGMSEKQQLSFIGRVNYAFKNKYLISINSRYDGSSVFGINNRWGFFPSGAVAWRLSEEEFIQNLRLFNDLKLRASYGISGSEALSPYASLARLSSRPSYIINDQQVVGYRPSSIAVPDLSWEQTAQLDIGLDASFWSGRLTLTADYYKKNTSRLFLNVQLPLTSGVGAVTKNTGSLQNTGWEFHISAAPVRGALTWDTDLNVSFQRQKVTNLGSTPEILLNVGLEGFSNAQVVRVGEPLGAFYGYPNDGIWQTSELEGLGTVPMQFGVPVQPGDLKYIDQNGDGDVTSEDRRIIGYALPKFFGGWNNTLRYKGFDLSLFMDYVYGNDIFNVNRYHTMMTIRHHTNKHRDFLDYWSPTNPSNTVPRLDYNQPANALTDYLMEDGSYFRIREITLGYSIPTSVVSKIKLNRLRVYMTASNLFTFTKYSGYNPDVNTYGNNTGIFNVDFGSYPMYSTYLVGVNVGF